MRSITKNSSGCLHFSQDWLYPERIISCMSCCLAPLLAAGSIANPCFNALQVASGWLQNHPFSSLVKWPLDPASVGTVIRTPGRQAVSGPSLKRASKAVKLTCVPAQISWAIKMLLLQVCSRNSVAVCQPCCTSLLAPDLVWG